MGTISREKNFASSPLPPRKMEIIASRTEHFFPTRVYPSLVVGGGGDGGDFIQGSRQVVTKVIYLNFVKCREI